MIDEKELIEEIKSLRVTITGLRAGKSILNEYAQHFKDSVIKIIDEQQRVDEWIPVKDRLPKNGGAYLITAINDCGGVYMDVSYYDSQYKSFSYDGVEDHNAIAWMDLPKMYEVKE